MKASVCVLLVATCGVLRGTNATGWTNTFTPSQLHVDVLSGYGELCQHSGINVAQDFADAVNNFTKDIYTTTAMRAKDHFVVTPLALWLTLAGMAEGAEGSARDEIFSILRLPEDECLRQKYYELAAKREITEPEIRLYNSRILAMDESLFINPYWNNLVRSSSLLTPISMPLKRDPAGSISSMRKLIAAQIPKINLDGNSFLLGSLDYQGLWTMAFANATIEDAPFYNDFGQQIGNVELMKIQQRVTVAYLPEQQMKVLVLPVGRKGRYCVMFGISVGNTRCTMESFTYSVVADILSNMQHSPTPIEVAIPRFSMRTEVDLRSVLEEIGVTSIWFDPSATRNISIPASLTSSFIHRTTITISNAGVVPHRDDQLDVIEPVKNINEKQTELDPVFGRDFIANRPFLFGLFDTELYNCIFGSIFSHPPATYVPIEK